MLRSALTSLIKTVAAAPPVARAFSHGSSCLMYHRVVEDDHYGDGFHPNRGLSVGVSAFDEQMRYMAQHFEPVSIPAAVGHLQAGTLTPRMVTVTFDDGYTDNLTLALPILRRYQIPATIYVTTAGPNRERCLWWYELEHLLGQIPAGSFEFDKQTFTWQNSEERARTYERINQLLKRSRPELQNALLERIRLLCQGAPEPDYAAMLLNWDQVRELDADPLITIGCHTRYHHSMTQLTEMELAADLSTSKSLLERELGHVVRNFAYPYGQRAEATLREFEAVRSAGFSSAVTTRFGHWLPAHKNTLFALPRVTVTCHDTLTEFKLKIQGVRATVANRGWRVVTN